MSNFDTSPVRNELRAIRKLCNGAHKNIVEVFSHGELSDTTHIFIDMELCDLNLDQYNQSSRAVGLVYDSGAQVKATQIWDIMTQIANALVFIHGSNEVHRDLKPHNGISAQRCGILT
jgi:serine/threonine protein kinase